MDRTFRTDAPQNSNNSRPSEAWLFAQALLGKPVPDPAADLRNARAERAKLEWLAQVSPRHAAQLRKLQSDEAEARHQRELLEWLAGISTVHAAKLRTLLREQAETQDAQRRYERFSQSEPARIAEWNEVDHPRKPSGTGGGQWVAKGGGDDSSGVTASSIAPSKLGRTNFREPTPEMLELAHTWWRTKRVVDQARRDVKELPDRIASERAQLGSGGRYAYVHSQNLAKAQQDLETAKEVLPELEKQLSDLEKQYRDSGYDEVHYATIWTRSETLFGGTGIEAVGQAVAASGTPAGLQTTGIAFEIASAVLAAPALLRLGKAVMSRTLVKTSSSVPTLVKFTPGGKTARVLRVGSSDVSLISGRAGPAASLPKGTPGFNAITSTHVEGHAAALMRQKRIREATIYINNPRICLPCQQNLAHMLPPESKLTIVLSNGTSQVFIGNAR